MTEKGPDTSWIPSPIFTPSVLPLIAVISHQIPSLELNTDILISNSPPFLALHDALSPETPKTGGKKKT